MAGLDRRMLIALDPTTAEQAQAILRARESPERLVRRLIRAECRREANSGSALTQAQRDAIDENRRAYEAQHGDPLR